MSVASIKRIPCDRYHVSSMEHPNIVAIWGGTYSHKASPDAERSRLV